MTKLDSPPNFYLDKINSKRRVCKQSVIHLCYFDTLVHDTAFMHSTLLGNEK